MSNGTGWSRFFLYQCWQGPSAEGSSILPNVKGVVNENAWNGAKCGGKTHRCCTPTGAAPRSWRS